ncbi:MAG: rane protein required for N-linked glycosylation-like protein [Firmicutes bacterium]|nr:rane protein required for N-linked glycosylation-like protein [Bacillota bacterium]
MKNRVLLLILLGFLLVVELAGYQFKIDWANPQLVDTDCYMRLVRVEQLYMDGDWYDHAIHRSNWPQGEILHWSRLLDIILLAGAYIGCPFVGFKASLFWWGMIVSPILHVACMAGLLWAARSVFELDTTFRLGLIFLGQAGIWGYCYIGRSDHHSLLLLLFILLLGCCFRMFDDRYDCIKYSRYAGTIAAIAMWVSVESVSAIVMILGVLSVLWVWKVELSRSKAEGFTLALLLSSVIYFFVENPPVQVFAVVYDKLSIVHIVIFLVISLFWVHTRFVKYNSRFARAGAGIILLCILGAVLGCCFPGFFKGPFAGIDSRIVPIWLSQVQEVQPLWEWSQKGFAKMLLLIGPVTICLPYAIYIAINRRKSFPKEWLWFMAGMAVYVPLALYQLRWAAYAEVVLLFPTAFILQNCLKRIESLNKECWRSIVRVVVTIVFCVGYGSVALLVQPTEQDANTVTITKATKFLNELQVLEAGPKTIITDIDFGPEILYRTPHRVIATPYHRNGDGIILVHQVMSAQEDSEAYKLIKQRDADLILLSPAMKTKFQGNTFCGRLLSGQYPNWLKPIDLPDYLQGEILLYEVVRNDNN